MAKITLTQGSLYFLQEKDYLTGEVSPYVKIGLVRDEKATAKRILEHQTGNPREIIDYKTLEAPMVEHLETQLHYRFADNWVTGEWFKLSDKELNSVEKEAQNIIKEQTRSYGQLEESYKLGTKESSQEQREPSRSEAKIWERLIDEKLRLDILHAQKDIVGHKIKTAIDCSIRIPGVAHYQIKEGKDVFDEANFKEKNPLLHEEYMTQVNERVAGSFLLKKKKTLAKNAPEINSLKKELPKIDLTADDIIKDQETARDEIIEKYHLEYIELQKKIYVQQWKYDQLEADLKCYTGISKGLMGLCSWSRELKEFKRFDMKRFVEDRPGLYKKFTVYQEPTYSFIINSWRPYSKGVLSEKQTFSPTRIIDKLKMKANIKLTNMD